MAHRRPYDKVEQSPNSLANCRICKSRISKGCWRIGAHYLFERTQAWNVKYYHKSCCEQNTKILNGLKLPCGSTNDACNLSGKRKHSDISATQKKRIEEETTNHLNSVNKRHRVVHNERGDLRELLRKLRLKFASHLDVAPYMILSNSVLDSLVETMPSNKEQFLQIKGLGPKKYEKFGTTFLFAISQYKAMKNSTGMQQSSNKHQNILEPTSEKDDSDDIVFEKELTVSDIVERRFKEAKEKGNIVEL
jgi:superfamily II DNA helicase RecQ